MLTGKLTARKVMTATPGRYNDGGNLYLFVERRDVKSYVFRYMIAGKARWLGLGSAATVSLEEAREKARQLRAKVHRKPEDGGPVDVLEERRAARKAQAEQRRLEKAKAMTFKQCAEAYIAAHSPGWRNPKHAKQWPATLAAYAYPTFGDLPVQAVDTALVCKAIESIWLTKSETASRVRGRIEAVLDWAKARGYRDGENPARWKGHLENLLPQKSKVAKVEHHAALPYGQIGTFMVELRQQKGLAGRALEFAILTAARTNEALGATWDEFDLSNRLWVVQGERMKAGKEHRVPLSDRAMQILGEMAEIRMSAYVFPGAKSEKPLSNMAFLMLLRRMGHDELTAHGFRSSFADWAAERTRHPREVREMALAHTVSDKVEAAYRRGDLFEKRRRIMADWADFCAEPQPALTGQVVSIGALRA